MKFKYFFILLFSTGSLFAQGGNSGLKFLMTTESRVSSLGESAIINSSGVSSCLGNPAGLNLTNASEIQIGVLKSIQDINSQYLLAKLAASENFSFGFHLLNYKISDIEIREVPGESQGIFNSQYLSTGLSGAYKISEKINIGLTAKFLYEKIFIEEASGFGIDVGGFYQYSNELLFAAGINNIGSMNNLNEESTKLPTFGGIGAKYQFLLSMFTNNVAIEIKNNFEDNKTHLNASLESSYNNLISVRLGYLTGYDSKNITAGLGVKFSDLNLNYCFVPYTNNLGNHHSISLMYAF